MRRGTSTGALVAIGIAATLVLTGLSVVAVGAFGGWNTPWAGSASSCTVPTLPGTVVKVSLTNMGGPMMGQRGGRMNGVAMRLTADQATVSQGAVSFLVTNVGSLSHEMVILPLADGQIAGTRTIGGNGQVDEATSVGEASNTCGEGGGEGILPATSSWVTVTLKPGRYELICNLPGHYAAGMYTQLTVE